MMESLTRRAKHEAVATMMLKRYLLSIYVQEPYHGL